MEGEGDLMETELLNLIAGPAGGVIVCMVVLVAVYRLTISHIIPMGHRYIDSVEERWVEQMETHKVDREIFKTSIQDLSKSQVECKETIAIVATDVKDIKAKLGA